MKRLRRGDVILTASPGHVLSAAIRTLTASAYSHAILVLDPPFAMESSDWGVVRFNLERFAVRSTSNVVVRRLSQASPYTFDAAEALATAERAYTAEYAMRDMVLALFARVPPTQSGKYFCSQLVADAYRSGGVPVGGRLPSAKVTPGMLASTTLLEDVPDALLPKKANLFPFTPLWLDGSHEQTGVEAETAARQEALRLARPFFEAVGLKVTNFYDALQALGSAWLRSEPFVEKLDQAFASAIRASGLLEIASAHFPPHHEVFFLDFYVRQEIVDGMPQLHQQQLLEQWERALAGYMKDIDERAALVDSRANEYHRSQLESLRLQLSGEWDALLHMRRIESALARGIAILKESLAPA